MKGKTQIFAVLAALSLLFISPKISTADLPAGNSNSFSTNASSGNTIQTDIERVMIDGSWWILIFHGINLIDFYPE